MAGNSLLDQVENGIKEKTPPELRSAVDRLVVAGMKVMFDPSTHDIMLQQIDNGGGATPDNVATGVAALLTLISQQAKGPVPPGAYVGAAIILMCEALRFLEKSGDVTVDENFLAAATQALLAAVSQKLGISPEQIAGAANAGAKAAPQGPAAAPQPAAPGGLVQQQMGA